MSFGLIDILNLVLRDLLNTDGIVNYHLDIVVDLGTQWKSTPPFVYVKGIATKIEVSKEKSSSFM